jgi:hypothetical protein
MVLLCCPVIAQYNTQSNVTPIDATIILADSVASYDQDGRVAVILSNPDPKPVKGLMIEIKSDAKWVSVQAGKTFTDLRPLKEVEAGKWLLVGQAGKYLGLIVESDPDGPPVLQFIELHLGEIQPEPDPVPDDPGDFESLTAMDRASMLAMAEPRVSDALHRAYLKVSTDPNLKIGDASGLRQATLLELRGVTRPWHLEFSKWDTEANRLGFTDVVRYRAALAAIAEGLKTQTVNQVIQPANRVIQQPGTICIDGVCYPINQVPQRIFRR